MEMACLSGFDYEAFIREEYFPFWDEETKRVWTAGLDAFRDLCGSSPDADVGDHNILCQLLVDKGLAVRHPLSGAGMELFLALDAGIRDRSLCWDSDGFIATAGTAREILIAMAARRCKGAEG